MGQGEASRGPKGWGWGEKVFSIMWGGAGMGLYFLAPLCLVLLRVIIVNFSYPKTLLFKQTY